VLQLGIIQHLDGDIEGKRSDHAGSRERDEVAQGLGHIGGPHAGHDLREFRWVPGEQIEEFGSGGHRALVFGGLATREVMNTRQ